MNEWVKPVDVMSAARLDAAIAGLVSTPPALTRLEPLSVSGDPAPGSGAHVADPLWFLGRQWQLGELLGEDVGTPVAVQVTSRNLPLTAWLPEGDDADGAWQAWPAGANLDELVQHIPYELVERGLRWRAETGAHLHAALVEAGQAGAADLLVAAHPLEAGDDDGFADAAADRLHAVLAGSIPDGLAALRALSDGTPPWVSGAADSGVASDVAADWAAWVTGIPGGGGAWTTERLEHRFSLRFGHGADGDAAVVRARAFGDGSVRWHDVVWDADATVELDGDEALPVPEPITRVMLATPLRYPGMPADRYWQLEDGSVDVAAISAQPHDLARLCLAEFALVSGDDWLVAPVDGEVGSLVQVQEVILTNTFGEPITVAEDADDRRGRGFRMFEVTDPSDGASLPGVLVPPVATDPVAGEPIEEVLFLRDETANMAWAVERVVPGRSGDPRQRSAEPRPPLPDPPDDVVPGDLRYEIESPVPEHWIPLVPVSTGLAQVGLRKGALLRHDPVTGADEPVLPVGRLLEPTPLTFPAEEIPREGVHVRTVPVLAPRRDGTYARWTARHVRTGRGEGHSGLAYDSAR